MAIDVFDDSQVVCDRRPEAEDAGVIFPDGLLAGSAIDRLQLGHLLHIVEAEGRNVLVHGGSVAASSSPPHLRIAKSAKPRARSRRGLYQKPSFDAKICALGQVIDHEASDDEYGPSKLKRNRYVDHGVSGSKTSRPGLDALLADAQPGDTIVVYKLDRLGRSTAHVAGLIHDLTERGIFIESTQDGLNSSTPTGRAMLQMLAIFAEMERGFIQERTVAGLAAAKEQGRLGGRPKVADSTKARQAQALRDAGSTMPEIAAVLGISIATAYRITKAPAKQTA